MGFMDDVRNIENSGNAAANMGTANATEILVILNLMQMQWPGLDQGKAAAKVDKYLKKNRLSAGR